MGRMTPYERVVAILRGRKGDVERLPCMNPYSTATREFMKVTNAWWPEAHRNPDKMAKLGSAAHRICGLDNVSIPFDIVVEAEVLGVPVDFHEAECRLGKLLWPSSKKRVINPEDLKIPEDASRAGRVPVIVEAVKMLKRKFEGRVPVNVFTTPPFTCLSSYIVDPLTFMKMMVREPEKVHIFLEASLETFVKILNTYEEAGVDIITFHEMGASTDLISPSHFEEFVAPYLKKLVNSIKAFTILSVCGSAELIIDRMVDCGADAIAVDEKTRILKARKIVDEAKANYPLAGNISPKSILNDGTPEIINASVKEAVGWGVDIVAPGCDFWVGTPTKNIEAFVEAVEELRLNEARNKAAEQNSGAFKAFQNR